MTRVHMADVDKVFAGNIPGFYDKYMVPSFSRFMRRTWLVGSRTVRHKTCSKQQPEAASSRELWRGDSVLISGTSLLT
jgi:hypothetical protein